MSYSYSLESSFWITWQEVIPDDESAVWHALLQVIMPTKTLLLSVCLLRTILAAGACSTPKDICIKSGEMVALHCKCFKEETQSGPKLIWTDPEGRELNSNMSSAEQKRMGVLLYRWSLIILNTTVNHQGNYSCSQRHGRTPSRQFWSSLRVYTTESREYEERTMYSRTCYTEESCTLDCPDVNIPDADTPNITSNDIVWHKKGESDPKNGFFSSVEEKDQGVYTCTRPYLYLNQKYNMFFTVELDVQPHEKSGEAADIIYPHHNDVFHVDLDSTVVIPCKAVVFSPFDSLVWLSGKLLYTNESLRVFYNVTTISASRGMNITASLVIKKVTEADLSKNYSCKLESVEQLSSVVNITLAQKARPSYVSLAVGVVCTAVVMVVISVVYVKFKISITLFLRDTLGCHRNTSDGKSYDAFLMFYKSDTDTGLNEEDREWLRSALEEKFGYSLCLQDRDILPGKAVAEAVLDCIEQSSTVVLVPTSPDPGLGSGLLSVIHSALVEKETRLVFIETESNKVSKSGSVPEALQLLSKAGDCVTWKGKHSTSLSSSFWKQLRYHLPAPQHTPGVNLLPHTV
ncbi:X-linked interleukin-1 receptor accessory protein-like 2 [Halichoeres trimaculatus]|uniref:X-linked interleukin-1 receptor accessory protein-like 2 n=1 Tax=Halichoeres trimaculatus TaxID=147232 RepID=UPI003D9FAF30